MTSEDDNKQSTRSPGISSPSPEDEEGSQDSYKMEDTSLGVVRDSTTIEPWNAPGLGDDTKNGMASRPPQTKGIPGSAYKDMQEEGRIQERPEDRLQTEARMLPPSDKRHGPSAQPRPVPLPEDSTVSAGEGETIGAPGAKATLQQQTDVARGGDEAPGRNKTIGETSGTTGVYTGPSAGDDSRRQTDGSEDKEEKGMYAEPSKEEKSIKTNGETSGTTGVYTGPSAGDDSRRQTVGSEDKEEKGMYAEPSKEESSCRQTEPNTRDASALPDGDFLAPRGAASVLSRTQPRVRGTLATFPEETDNAREPGDPSRDSTNPVLGVRTRLCPTIEGASLTTKDVTHANIVRVVTTELKRPLTEADSILFDSPVVIDDPERWLDWFSTTLNTCEEARTGNRNFEQERVAMVADTRWSPMFRNGIGAAELAGIGPYPDLQGTIPGVLAAIGLLASSADGRARLKKRVSMEGAVMFYLPDIGVQLTLPLRDLEATRLHSHIWRVRRRTLTSRRRYLESATEGLDLGVP
ncbi:hypothetical protein B5M09_013453 [Aphanomyces astaci]|uniref:Uncharacterized protein n=1 Tax=Aphanomyces astaci TaxID=112090 RepID=A0A425CUX7_APHAT|nr:hypothetical protein B5M09_013453 [Aphanomyces astaci]